jgi:hypothetical protein
VTTKVNGAPTQVLILAERGDRRKEPERCEYRALTLDEMKRLGSADGPRGQLYIIDDGGRAARVRQNGRPRTWKTRPTECEVSWRHGLYVHGRARVGELFVRVESTEVTS